MIRHIVFFTARPEHVDAVVEGLELLGQIPHHTHFEVSRNDKVDLYGNEVDVVVYAEFADEAAPEDVVFEQQGVKILVDPKSLPYIDGTELDFVREGLNEGFRFNNPNERDRCGCGESFRI